MKILDVLSVKLPNAFKDKNPKKVVYKNKKSVYGDGIAGGSAGSSGGAGGGCAGGAGGGAGGGQ